MKVGDKIKIKGSKVLQCWVVTEVGGELITAIDCYAPLKNKRFDISSVIVTTLNPKIFKTIYGVEWLENVESLLKAAKISFKTNPRSRTDSCWDIFVDARKHVAAQAAYDSFYKKLAG